MYLIDYLLYSLFNYDIYLAKVYSLIKSECSRANMCIFSTEYEWSVVICLGWYIRVPCLIDLEFIDNTTTFILLYWWDYLME